MSYGTPTFERFEIEALAGTGAMGRVFRARDRTTGERVALKVLVHVSPEDRERFAREADALSRIRHPHVVRYVAHGMDETEPYLAMEWLEGVTLDDRLRTSNLSPEEGIELARAVASALSAAHKHGITHRDVKPTNLFLVGADPRRAKLVDFGIALHERHKRITHSDVPLGTPRYMAPEQARGLRDRVGAASDVFGLGAVLFRAIAGRTAVEGEGVLEILFRIVTDEAPRLADVASGVSDELDELCAAMLQKDPAARPSMDEVVARLAAISSSADVVAAPRSLARPALGARERALRCLVIARPNAKQRLDVEDLRRRVAPAPAELDVLADGSILASVRAGSVAADQAASAARAALALRSALEGASLAVVATHQSRGSDDPGARRSPVALPAAPGIVVDDAIAKLLGDKFELVHAPDGRLVLVGEAAALPGNRTLLGKRAPFVGREREVAALEQAFDACARERAARAVVVLGAPGVGKSRLRDAFLERIAARRDAPAVWIGRGDPMRVGAPFGLLSQAIRCGVQATPGDANASEPARLRAFVDTRVPASDAPRVAEFLGEMLGFDSPEPSSQLRAAHRDPMLFADQAYRAFEEIVAGETRRAPLAIVLEDLHWGDVPTVRFVDGILQGRADAPLFVLALARPEVAAVFPNLFAGRVVTELTLGELSRGASEELVRRALGQNVDAALAATILERAEGNPFFLEELVRAVSEGRRELPATVLAVLQARLDALDEGPRRVLRAASILGRSFWRGAVVELLGGRKQAALVDATLAELVQKELITPRPIARFADERELVFRHAMLRDAVYATLTDEDRALGHKLSADWLERAGERDARVLADHLERSGQLARAAVYGLRAAEQALEGNDFAGAAALAAHATPFAPNPELKGALLERQAEAHRWGGDAKASAHFALEAMAISPRGSATYLAAAAHGVRSSSRISDRKAATDVARALLAAAGTAHPAAWIAAGAASMAGLLPWGEVEIADRIYERLEALAPLVTQDPLAYREVVYARFWRAHTLAEVDMTLDLVRELIARSEVLGDVRWVSHNAANAGAVLTQLGEIAEAVGTLRRSLDISKRMRLEHAWLLGMHNLGLALAYAGQTAEAIEAEREAIRGCAARGDKRLEAASYGYLARAMLVAGDAAGARDAALRGLALPQSETSRGQRVAALSLAELGLGRVTEALAAADEAVRIVRAMRPQIESIAIVEIAAIEAHAAVGDTEGARDLVLAASARLLAVASRFAHPRRREAYLHGMPDHARLLTLAARLSDDGR